MYQLAARMGNKMASGAAEDMGFHDVLRDVMQHRLYTFTAAANAEFSSCTYKTKSTTIMAAFLATLIDYNVAVQCSFLIIYFSFFTGDQPIVPGAPPPHTLHHLRPGECK